MRNYGRLLETEFSKLKKNVKQSKLKGVSMHQETRSNINEVWVKVEKENDLKRDEGNYVTFYLKNFDNENLRMLVTRLSLAIKKLCKVKPSRILFLGMGNSEIISDALGVKTLDFLDIGELRANNAEICFAKFCPGVFAVSGFESFEIVSALNVIYKPDLIIVIDSLCAGSVSKLGSSFQLTDAGITPGSAVGGKLTKISSETLGGVKVISIGVPVVIYLQSVIEEATQKLKPLEENTLEVLDEFDGIFSPKDIDKMISSSSEIIAKAIKQAFI